MNRLPPPALARLFTSRRAADTGRNLGDALGVALIFGLLATVLWLLAGFGLTETGLAEVRP